MKPTQILAIAAVGALIGASAGFGIKYFSAEESAGGNESESKMVSLDTVPDFEFPDLDGQARNASEWRDRILVLNFWATWCPPCRKEMPMFNELQEKFARDRVHFVGIAIDDPEPVREFVESVGVAFPILLGDLEAIELSKRLGNRFEGLPFTIVAEPGGKIIMRHQGGIEYEQLEPVLQSAVERIRPQFASPERI